MIQFKEMQHIKLFSLEDYDGADGRSNSPSGFLTFDEFAAKEWNRVQSGNSYKTIEGILIDSLNAIPKAKEHLAKQKALSKLTPEEIKLLGIKL